MSGVSDVLLYEAAVFMMYSLADERLWLEAATVLNAAVLVKLWVSSNNASSP